jgi:hypothetical protein
MENGIGLIIQLRITDHWGTDDEFNAGVEFELALDEAFQGQACGEVDGNDFGSGTMNIFIYTSVERWDKALRLVVTELEKRKLLDGATIAKSVEVNGDDREYTVVWPEDYQGSFSPF